MRSKCCHALMKTVTSDEGTSYWKCIKCGKATDPSPTEEWEKKFKFELDEVFESMGSYTGKMIYEDALFERVLIWGRSFIEFLLSQQRKELVEKLKQFVEAGSGKSGRKEIIDYLSTLAPKKEGKT